MGTVVQGKPRMTTADQGLLRIQFIFRNGDICWDQ
jgi:hypothetical protein